MNEKISTSILFTALPDEIYERLKAVSFACIESMMEIYEGNTQKLLMTSQVILTQVLCMIIDSCQDENANRHLANRTVNSLKASITQNFPDIIFEDEK